MTTSASRALCLGLLLLAGTGPARAADAPSAPVEWLEVAVSDHKQVYVNPATVKTAGGLVDARFKENFAQPQPSTKQGRSYLSAKNDYRFDCAQRKLAYRKIETYEAVDFGGKTVQKAKFGDKNLTWMDAPDGTVFGAMLAWACAKL